MSQLGAGSNEREGGRERDGEQRECDCVKKKKKKGEMMKRYNSEGWKRGGEYYIYNNMFMFHHFRLGALWRFIFRSFFWNRTPGKKKKKEQN